MLLDVQPIPFTLKNGLTTFVDDEGRMAWNVGPNSQMRFRVVCNLWPLSQDLQNEKATWQCECPRGRAPRPIGPAVCDHIQDAYLYWLNAENKKRKMMEEVKQHAVETERHAAVVKETKPVEPQKGFAIKPKRIINLEDE